MDRLGIGKLRAAVVEGDVEYGSVMAGQSAAMVREIQPAAAIIAEVMAEAAAVIFRLAGLVE